MAIANQGNISKIDYLMSPQRDFPRQTQGAKYRYVLCTTPRCGSNLVSDMLYQTDLAGNPMEYLNGRYLAGFQRSKTGQSSGRVDINQYLVEMEQRRTSSNGYFGIKVHYEHLSSIWKNRIESATRHLAGYNKVILLRRRDKIAQAVSLHKARVTQVWSSLDYQFLDEKDPKRYRKAEFDLIRITEAFAYLVKHDQCWRDLLIAAKIPFDEFFYEDFVDDFKSTSKKLLAAIGLHPSQDIIAAPRLIRQGQDIDPMVEKFKKSTGIR